MIRLVVAAAVLGQDPRPRPQPGWDDAPAPVSAEAPTPPPADPPASVVDAESGAPPAEASIPPGPPDPRPAAELERRRTLALRGSIVGFVGFGIAYVTSASIGAVYLSDAEALYPHDPGRGRAFGRRMLIPVVGPFLAIEPAKTTFGRVGAATLGVVQVGSLAGAVVGIARHVALGKDRAHVRVSGLMVPDGGGVSVSGRF